jgi:hypothetical protein
MKIIEKGEEGREEERINGPKTSKHFNMRIYFSSMSNPINSQNRESQSHRKLRMANSNQKQLLPIDSLPF